MRKSLAEVLRDHQPIAAGPAYCSGCGWAPEGEYSDDVFADHLVDLLCADWPTLTEAGA